MTKTELRNSHFVELIRNTRNTDFDNRILQLRAFARGAGCAFKFDSEHFELWSNDQMVHPQMIYRVVRGKQNES